MRMRLHEHPLETVSPEAHGGGCRAVAALDGSAAVPKTCGLKAVAFISLFILVVASSSRMFHDPDTYWHIAVGRLMWTTGTFPRTDPFSHTFAGAPWIAKEWLSQLILFGAYELSGWTAVTLVVASITAMSFTTLFASLLGRARWTVALIILLLSFILSMPEVSIRPQILALPPLVLWVCGLQSALIRRTSPSWWLILLVVLWANIHASVPIALATAALFAVEAVAAAPGQERLHTASTWGIFLSVALAAAGATPYGYEPLLIPIRVMGGGNEAVRYVEEWRPLHPDLVGLLLLLSLVGMVIVGATLIRRRDWPLGLSPNVLCAYLAISHARFTYLFAVVASITISSSLVRAFPQLKPIELPFRREAVGGLWIAVSALASIAVMIAALTKPHPDAAISPSAALKAAQDMKIATGPVFNAYNYGGYLIFRGVKTFIDGRTDQLFVGGFMERLEVAEGSGSDTDFLGLLMAYHVSWALVRSDTESSLRLARAEGWEQVYVDRGAAVYAIRPEGVPDKVPGEARGDPH